MPARRRPEVRRKNANGPEFGGSVEDMSAEALMPK